MAGFLLISPVHSCAGQSFRIQKAKQVLHREYLAKQHLDGDLRGLLPYRLVHLLASTAALHPTLVGSARSRVHR